MKHQLIISALLLFGASSVWAQNAFEDDIYYNPNKAKTESAKQKKEKKNKQSAYIANMGDMDIDAYNRRGEAYYTTSVDTIGSFVENGEDFVYTQQIQKFYNPKIVVNNADILEDVLSNAYGNVDIVINNNGWPVFSPYSYAYCNWPYYSSWWASPSWRFNLGFWGVNIGFYDPWYAWNWGPAWGPSWGWGWGPAWGGPAWGPAWGGPGWGPAWRPPMASYRPNGHRPVAGRPGWSGNTRPGGNIAHRAPSVGRPMGNTGGYGVGNSNRPGNVGRPGNTGRPGNQGLGVNNNGGRWEYNTTGNTGHRQPGTGVVNSGGNRGGNSAVTNSNNGYNRGNANSGNSNRGYNRGNTNTGTNNNGYNRGNSNSNNNRGNSNSGYNRGNSNSGSYNRGNGGYSSPSRSTGGYGGGGRSTGGGFGGGGRGGRR